MKTSIPQSHLNINLFFLQRKKGNRKQAQNLDIIEVTLKECYKIYIMKRAEIGITGIVQGIGFRPFIYNLAKTHSILGWVLNNEQGVFVDAESEDGNLDQFIRDIPALALPWRGLNRFR